MGTRDLSEPQRKILEAAVAVFSAHGYRGGSLNDVAKRSGYTRAGLLHHYPSKEAMLLALLDLRDRELELESWGNDPEQGIHDMLRTLPAMVDRILKDRVLIQLGHVLTSEASHPEHPARDWAANRHRTLRGRMAAAIERSIGRGELAPGTDADSLAALLLGAVEGVEAQWLVDPEVDPRRCAQTLLLMLDALTVGSATDRPGKGSSGAPLPAA
ncbi:TetR/AcrR family transcriptional regulator [Arthrobacter sp. NPDC056691]|uniref:TetR/AcrR family transcriptional regulator n=1 Tax=Arthrobacter sp. NPDC056691 TaxID=3345913 RepID=UPI0036722C52